jgi:hypothetical protein
MTAGPTVSTIVLAATLCLMAGVQRVAAQEPVPPAQANLAALLEEQHRTLEEQRRLIDALTKQLAETNALALETKKRLEAMEQEALARVETTDARLAEVERSQQKPPELETVQPNGEFPGSLDIPGTEAAIRVGGQVRLMVVRNIGAIGTDDRFVTSSIPVEGSPDADKTDRTTLSATPSRFNIDFRTPTQYGDMRAFLEGDFAGDARTYRLRHAFGTWRALTVGQTWSTFSDPEAEPDGIDFEGLNAISLFRQPILRWTHPLSERFRLALAAENPAPDITGANGVSQVPDVVAQIRFDRRGTFIPGDFFSGRGHTQVALLIRQIRGEPAERPDETLSVAGVGVHLSGRISAPWRERDLIKFAGAAGSGIGRYITDLGAEGGQDAVYDPATNSLHALEVRSGYAGYELWWTDRLRSTLTFGAVYVDNLEIQDPDALHQTLRSSINLAWSPIPSVDLVMEFLSGTRVNKDRAEGRASQLQVGWTFRF